MTATLQNVTVTAEDWQEVYALTSILAGNPIYIQNIGRTDLFFSISATKPPRDHNAYEIFKRTDRITVEGGDLKVWVFSPQDDGLINTKKIADSINNNMISDAWGVDKVSLPHSLFHGLFTFDIPASMWFTYENGIQVYDSSDISSVNSAGRLLTTAANPTLLLESRECPRYQPNRGHLLSNALWCPLKTNNGSRQWGVGIDGENGVFFRLKSDGLIYAVLLSGGIEVRDEVIDTVPVASFDVEKGNVYDIQFQWRGVGGYFFFINLQCVHAFDLIGTLTALSMENPALPICFKAERITQDVEINIGCADLTSENGKTDKEQYGSAYAEAVPISSDDPVIVVRQPLLIGTKANTRTVTLARITVSCSKKATFKVWSTRSPSDIIGATFKALGNGSFVETDSTNMDPTAVKATEVLVANMRPITAIHVESLVSQSLDNPHRGRIEFPLVRGDYLVVTGSAASGSADCVIEWGEQV